MKRLIIIHVLILCLMVTGGLGAKAVSIHLNDAPTTVNVLLYNSTSYVPLRAVSKLLLPQAKISWQVQQAVMETPNLVLTAQPGTFYINANGRMLYAKDGIKLINNTTYVPVRLVAKALGANVTWEPTTQKVWLYKGSGTILSGDAYYHKEDLYWLSKIIYAECRGEPLNGKIAVGNVVLNRVESPDFPNSVRDVVFDQKFGIQFTPVENGSIYDEPDDESIIAAKLCLDGASVVGNSIYFLNPVKASNFWTVNHCTYVATIGRHQFYAEE